MPETKPHVGRQASTARIWYNRCMIKTSVNLGGLEMPTFLATASGTFGYGFEYVGAVD